MQLLQKPAKLCSEKIILIKWFKYLLIKTFYLLHSFVGAVAKQSLSMLFYSCRMQNCL